jgi:predicted nucleic acid-binding protein
LILACLAEGMSVREIEERYGSFGIPQGRDAERPPILVDSGLWIDYCKGLATAQPEKLDSLPGSEPLAIGDLILTEVLQGFADESGFQRRLENADRADRRRVGREEIAIQAARNFRALRNAGVTVRKTVDTVIAARCIESGHELLHEDRISIRSSSTWVCAS